MSRGRKKPQIKDWKGPAALKQVETHLEKGTKKACAFAVGEMKKLLGRSQPIKRTGGRSGKERMVGLDPSKPGEPPKKVTSQLQLSCTYRMEYRRHEFIRGYVGSPLKKAAALELGFSGKIPFVATLRWQVTVFGRRFSPFPVVVRSHSKAFSQPARPFARPAVVNNSKKIRAIIVNG